jgi:hypothetical protein
VGQIYNADTLKKEGFYVGIIKLIGFEPYKKLKRKKSKDPHRHTCESVMSSSSIRSRGINTLDFNSFLTSYLA